MMEKSVWRTSGHGSSPFGDESEDGNRASFPRRGKRSVISNHFTELVLEIMEVGMLYMTTIDLKICIQPRTNR